MRSPPAPDISSLARLAQNPAAELRPLLLHVQAQTFANAPGRDPSMVASFESIALGLIPLVSDDVLADMAAILRPVSDVPPRVAEALERRLGRPMSTTASAPEPVRASAPAPQRNVSPSRAIPRNSDADRDLALAADPDTVLDGRALSALIDRAIDRPDLAELLLERSDLSRFDRAALYRYGSKEQRSTIRLDLASVAALASLPRPPGLGEQIPAILRAAERGDLASILATAVTKLGIDPDIFDLGDPAGRELFTLALVALGLNEAECIRVLITLGTEASRSVEIMRDLARIARETPWPVAAFLAGSEGPARPRYRSEAGLMPPRASGSLRADGRADPAKAASRRDWILPGRAPIAQGDRRS